MVGDPAATEKIGALRKELGADFDYVYNKLKDGNLRIVGETEAATIRGRGTVPGSPSEMSDNLVNIRSTLNDPRAVEAFNNKFAKMRGNSEAMERAMEGIRKKGSDIEERMLQQWKKDNPTPKGAGLSRVPDALSRGQKLRDEVEAFKIANPDVEGVDDWFRRIKGETDNLNAMRRGTQEAKPEVIGSALDNLGGVKAELRYAQAQPGVVGVGQKMTFDGIPEKVDVDVIADNGRTWIDTAVCRYNKYGHLYSLVNLNFSWNETLLFRFAPKNSCGI